jgi:cell wall-associated NlpC family hydrolase
MVSFGYVYKAEAMSPALEKAWTAELEIIISRHPHYQWGGATDEAKGLDCSGYLYLAARRAGFPVRRTTAKKMLNGYGGWANVAVFPAERKPLDLVGWSFRKQFDHIGLIWKTPYTVTHSSSRRGVVVDDLRGALVQRAESVKRLTLGDE